MSALIKRVLGAATLSAFLITAYFIAVDLLDLDPVYFGAPPTPAVRIGDLANWALGTLAVYGALDRRAIKRCKVAHLTVSLDGSPIGLGHIQDHVWQCVSITQTMDGPTEIHLVHGGGQTPTHVVFRGDAS